MAQKQNQQSPPSSLRNLCVSAVDCIGYRRGAENAEATPQNDAALLCSHRALYLLNFDTAWHQQAIDSVQVLSVEEADLDLSFPFLRDQNSDLRAKSSPEFVLSRADVGINRPWRWPVARRFVLRHSLNQQLGRSD